MTRVVVNIPDNVDLSKVNDIKLCIRYCKNNNEYSYVTEGFSVQEERPKGEWILNKDENPECPFCHRSSTYWGNFCSNCGADLRGKEG